MGRWVIFFTVLFGVGNFFASAMGSGTGYIAVARLTADLTAIGTTVTVSDTDDFPSAPAGYLGYFQIDDEIMSYTDVPLVHDATHFYQVTRGVTDPITNVPTSAVAHLVSGGQQVNVRSLEIAALESGMTADIASTSAGFGAVDIFKFPGRFFSSVPKYVSWDYPFLADGPIVYFKYFVLYPLSIAFVLTLCVTFIAGIFGIIKSVI